MEVREKESVAVEPITKAEVKTYLGYSSTDQDDIIDDLIVTARQHAELVTAVSFVSKSYEAQFVKNDAYDGWYLLPFSPVVSITSAKIDTTDVEYYSKGLNAIEIYPQQVISTGTSNNVLNVEFVAGKTEEIHKTILLRIVSDLFNAKTDNIEGSVSTLLSFSTQSLLDSISNNTSI